MRELARETESPIFRRVAETVLAHRALYGGLVLAITLVAMCLAQSLKIDMNVEAFMDQSSPELETLEVFRDHFGRDDVFVVLVEGDVFSVPYLERLRRLHDELAAIDMEIASLGQRRTARPVVGAAADADADAAVELAGGDAGDGFGDFDDFGSAESADGETADDWAGEAGGTLIDEITSLLNYRQVRGRVVHDEDGDPTVELVVGELMDPFPAAEALPALKAQVLADPKLVGQIVDAGGRVSLIALRTQFMDELDSAKVNQHIADILAEHRAEGFGLQLAGLPALGATLNDLVNSEIQKLFLVALTVVSMMILFIFRHVLGLAAPMVIVSLSMIWAFGFMAALDMPLTILSNVLPAFLVAVAVGDSIHIQSVYRDLRRLGVENREAIIRSVATTGKPVLFTTLTTMFGLLSFHFATIDAVGEMGTAAAFGVFTAFVHTVVVLPIVLSFNSKSMLGAKPPGQRDFIDRFVEFCGRLSGGGPNVPANSLAARRRTRVVLLCAALIAGTSLYGISLVRVWHNPLAWVLEDDPTRIAFEAMDAQLGGSASIQILVESKSPHGMKDAEILRGLDALEGHIREYVDPEIGEVIGASLSLVDVVKETHRALEGGGQAHYTIPAEQRGVSDTLFLFEQAGPAQLRRIATADLAKSQMSFRVKWMEATAYGPLTEHVDTGIREHLPPTAEVRTTGAAYTLFTTVSGLIFNLIRSFGVAFVVITLFMIVLLGDLRLGLIAMVPNLLPIAFVIGFMGFADVPLDMSNILIASIAIGLAVDDTIHFLHRFKVHYDVDPDVEGAISDALHHSGRAIVGTTLILLVGYLTNIASSLVSLQRFGYLLGLTVVVALVFDLVFSPALLRLAFRKRSAAA